MPRADLNLTFVVPSHARAEMLRAGGRISPDGMSAILPVVGSFHLERRGDFTNAETVRNTAHYVWVRQTRWT
jgi:hypothetical protein